MPFYVFAWTASILYSVYAIIAKLVGKHKIKNIAQFSFFITLFSGLVTGAIALLNGATFPENWTFIVLAALFLSLGNILYLTVLKSLDISVMTPLFNLRVVITVFLGFLFLGETLSTKSILLIAIIVVAGIFATMDEKFSTKSFFTKKIALGIFFMLTLSVQTLFINRAVAQTNYWTAMLWMAILAIVFSFTFLVKRFYKDVLKSKASDYSGIILIALLGGIGDLAAYKAFSGNIGISSIIVSLPLSMIFAFVLSLWKPDLLEKHTIKVYVLRFVSASIMIWGALQLSLK